MITNKLSKIFDTLFISLISFLISLVWLRYYFKNFTLSIILSLLITLLITNFFIIITFKKNKKINNKKLQKQTIEDFNNYLIFSTDEEKEEILFKILSNKNQIKKLNNNFIISSEENKSLFHYNYSFKKISIDDIINLYKVCKKNNCNKLIITSINFEKECFTIINKIKDIKIKLLDSSTFYNEVVIDSNFVIPNTLDKKEINKINIKDILNLIFTKKKAKQYFFSSIIILFSSFIVPYNIYYIIVFTILIGLTIISYVYPSFNKKQKEKLF